MKIAITGHRPNKLDNDYDLVSDRTQVIKAQIVKAVLDQINTIEDKKNLVLISGMALGIDTLFAEIAINLSVPFVAAIPCLGHSAKWSQKSKDRYQRILNSHLCTVYHVTGQPYTNYCMSVRNEWMVDSCDLLIAVWDGSAGGTRNCIQYALKVGKPIIYITP